MFLIKRITKLPSEIKPHHLNGLKSIQDVRTFFGYFRIAFNNVDQDRLKQVGPDRLCSEWILKNGGAIRYMGPGRAQISDYNSLGATEYRKSYIEDVNATDSSIMAIGFDHFKNCNHIKKITLNKCKHMENEALEKLIYCKDSLIDLSIEDCFNVLDSGLLTLKQLPNLQKLVISGVPYVKDIENVKRELIQSLPKCDLSINK